MGIDLSLDMNWSSTTNFSAYNSQVPVELLNLQYYVCNYVATISGIIRLVRFHSMLFEFIILSHNVNDGCGYVLFISVFCYILLFILIMLNFLVLLTE